ncbi:MAG TPA: 3-hydroxybutyryl-CoA dehydrogenase [Bacteroidetes bacterium]|nr:putative 3-hydroxybutyryl-CoA dehydrogenase [bacterium BMS3Bbin04]HDO66024.1 3-hydroxybutyryl-CoA dehydrogenase [Bacteroidota bacterium]HEX05149.1 3-hydroxybutyryl-CoA dehydrogenase [Bacteroidota bacterium]
MPDETLQDILNRSKDSMETSDSDGALTRIAVIGAGTMGLGIAHAVASKGLEVLLIEKDDLSLEAAIKQLSINLDREIARWGMTESDKRAVLSRIHNTTNLDEVEGYRLIIESIPDIMEPKVNLFKQLDSMANRDTVFVTNTSVLSVTELAEKTIRPDKFIGMHFLHPVVKRNMVEIVRGLQTSDETFEFTKSFAEAIDKTVVEVYESPGYVTTRVILPMLNEAMHTLMEGVATAEGIDTAIRLGYNFVQGPLQLADQMGLDEVHSWMEAMFHETAEQKYRPCPLLRKLVRAGHLGVKTGQGFFTYDETGRQILDSDGVL